MKTLKNILVLLVVATLAVSSVWSTEPETVDNPLIGTWRTALDNPNGSYGVKSYTNSHFNWYYATAKGHMYSAGAGTYEIKSKTHVVEHLEAADSQSSAIIGNQAEIDYEIRGDTMFSCLKFMGQTIQEQWRRVK